MFLGASARGGLARRGGDGDARPARRSPACRSRPCGSIRQPVASLSGGQRQSVAIAKAVLWNSQLVIMDEPTARSASRRPRMVLDLVRRLADRGLGGARSSRHNLNDVFEVADRIAVLLPRPPRHAGGRSSEFDRAASSSTSSRPAAPTARPQRRAAEPGRASMTADRQSIARPSPVDEPTIGRPTRRDADADRPRRERRRPLAPPTTCRGGERLRPATAALLPVIIGLILIAIIFQSLNSNFLSAGNLVNLLVQGSVFMLLAMGQVFVLLLGEIDLSAGFVGGVGGVVMAELRRPRSTAAGPGGRRCLRRSSSSRGDRRCSRVRSSPASGCRRSW